MKKKFIFNLLLVILTVFVLDFGLGKLLRYFYFRETSGSHFRTTYSIDSTRADVLIFGSSRATHHYVPAVFEDSLQMSYYNTGREGTGIFYQTAVLKAVLKRHKPKIIILDFASDFEQGGNAYDRLATLMPYYKSHPEMRSVLLLKSRFEKIKHISGLYPFNSQLFQILFGNMEFNKKHEKDDRGYVALNLEWEFELDTLPAAPFKTLDPVKINSFREFLTTARKAGTDIFVVRSPVFEITGNCQETQICTNICRQEQIPFIDISTDTLFLNDKHLFRDLGHLNHNGATIFSKMLLGKMKAYLNSGERQ